MMADTAFMIGEGVAVLDGDDRIKAHGTVVGVATWWPEHFTEPEYALVRGWVVALDGADCGWLDEGRMYVSTIVAHGDSLRATVTTTGGE